MIIPKLYIADLAAYNAGHLHGVWVEASDDIDDIHQQIQSMLSNSPVSDAEEYAIHDYEDFAGYRVSEYENIETLNEIACFVNEHGNIAGELLRHFSGDLDEATKAINDNYVGCYASLADYAESFTEETSEVPENLKMFIDYDAMGNSWEMSGDIFTIQLAYNEVHIFYAL